MVFLCKILRLCFRTYCPITRINNMGQTPISPTIMLKTSKFKSNGQQRYWFTLIFSIFFLSLIRLMINILFNNLLLIKISPILSIIDLFLYFTYVFIIRILVYIILINVLINFFSFSINLFEFKWNNKLMFILMKYVWF